MFSYRKCNLRNDFITLNTLKLRKADVEEARALSGGEGVDLLMSSIITAHEAYVVLKDNKIVGAFGVCNTPGREGGVAPFFASTNEIKSLALIKHSKIFIKKWLNRYGRLCNYVCIDNKAALKFLNHLGFKISSELYLFFDSSKPFVKFTMERG